MEISKKYSTYKFTEHFQGEPIVAVSHHGCCQTGFEEASGTCQVDFDRGLQGPHPGTRLDLTPPAAGAGRTLNKQKHEPL